MDKELLTAIGQMLEPINRRLESIEKEQKKQGEDISDIRQDITKINVTLENDIKKDLKLLHEGQAGMNEKFAKLDKVADDVEDIKIKVSAIESVTKDNTSQIKQLRKVN